MPVSLQILIDRYSKRRKIIPKLCFLSPLPGATDLGQKQASHEGHAKKQDKH
jgi:hypothetical protein